MKKNMKRILVLILALSMLVPMGTALADDPLPENNVLQVITGPQAWAGPEIPTAAIAELEVGYEYEFSMLVWTPDMSVDIVLQFGAPAFQWIVNTPFDTPNVGEWHTVTGNFDLSTVDTVPTMIQIVKRDGGPNANQIVTFWIDDFKVTKSGDSVPLFIEDFEDASHAFAPRGSASVSVVTEASITGGGEPPPPPPPPPDGKTALAHFATVEIPDGGTWEIEDIWKHAAVMKTDVRVEGTAENAATADVRALWDDDYLYVLFEVTTPTLRNGSVNVWENDSVEAFLSESNHRTGAYATGDGQYRVDFENNQSFGENPSGNDGFRSAVRLTDDGYDVIKAIPFNVIEPEIGDIVGFDAQVNDRNEEDTARVNVMIWNDHTGNSWASSANWGNLELIGPPGPQPGVPILIWEMNEEEALISLEDNVRFTTAGPISARNEAELTVRKETIIPEVHSWPFLGRSVTAVDVVRPAAGDGFMISAESLGMIPGETYFFDIEGRRMEGTQRAAFGTLNTAGTLAISGGAVGPAANDHPTRPGYFDMSRMIVHSASTTHYVFYGVAATGFNPAAAAGNFQLYNIRVSQANPFILYIHDFSDGTSGLVTGAGEHSVVQDSTNPDNYVYRSIIPPGIAGNWHGFDLTNPNFEWPTGATYRATFVVRRTADSPGVNARLRLATQTGGTVSNWDITGHSQQLGTEWTTYTIQPFTLGPGVGVQSFQFIRNSETWAGTMELDSVLIEIISAPAEELVGRWEPNESLPSLAESYKGRFTIGNILDSLPGEALGEMFLHQYNSITMENAMKPASLSPAKGVYTFDAADAVVNWALDNEIEVIGHALLWHSQSAAWLTNSVETGDPLTRAEARDNLRAFITEVAGHFSGRVSAWDVANEVFTGNGGAGLWHANMRTNSPWWLAYNNERNADIGEQPWDFVYDAFVFTRLADPYATLIYNDFNCNSLPKARNMRDMANELNARWAMDIENNIQALDTYMGDHVEVVEAYLADGGRLLVETLGLQMHHNAGTGIRTPGNNTDANWNVENSFLIYSQVPGITLAVTELDITSEAGFAYDPVHQENQFRELFELLIEYEHMVDRVTFWGVSDVQSWRGPQSPTLFARPTVHDPYFRAKPAFHTVAELPDDSVMTVSWHANGGLPGTHARTFIHEGTITELAAMTRAGFTFGGWFTNALFTGEAVVFPMTSVTAETTTLWAKWIADVIWNADGGLPVPTQTDVAPGGSINEPAAMTKAGHTFGGWFLNAELTGAAVTFPIENVNAPTTLWAKWTLDTRSISLTSGTMTFPAQTVGYDQPAARSTVITNTGNQVTGQLTVTAPTGFQVSLSQTTGFANSITVGSIAVEGTATFYTRPNTGLAAGTYSGNVIVRSTGTQTPPLTAQTRAVSFTVNPAAPTPTPTPPPWKEMTPEEIADVFEDVKVSDWFAPYVGWAYANNITDGIAGTQEFRPRATLNREMFVTFLWRMAGRPGPSGAVPEFADQAAISRWAADAVAWASSANVEVVTGFPDNTFGPGRFVSRQQIATLLHRFIEFVGGDYEVPAGGIPAHFGDRDQVAVWARDAVAWAVEHEIIMGIGTGTTLNLNPRGNAQRGQAVAMLSRTAFGFDLHPPE